MKVSVTALVKIIGHGSGGRGKIVNCIYKHLVARDALTSRYFLSHPVDSVVVVKLYYNTETKKRSIVDVSPIKDVIGFAMTYRRQLAKEELIMKMALEGKPYKEIANALREGGFTGIHSVEPIETVEPEKVAVCPKIEEVFAAVSIPAQVTNWQDAFYVQDEERNAFQMAKSLCGEIPAKVMIIGASGYGKTSLPKAFAAQNKMKYVRFNVALVRDPEEFFGWRTVENGDVKFMKSEFTKAITEGNAVVVLDELNRATPEMANALFPILDDDARTVVFGEEVKVGPNVIIVTTVNIGYQFVGTFSVDQALLNRMDITLRVAPLPRNVEREILVRRANVTEDQADVIVTVCNRLRDLTNEGKIVVDASTRTSIRVAKFVANGANFQDAFAWAIVNGADNEERKEIIDAISSVL